MCNLVKWGLPWDVFCVDTRASCLDSVGPRVESLQWWGGDLQGQRDGIDDNNNIVGRERSKNRG
ncbi:MULTISPECIES: hypothetical protein [Candidatus Ichthyocystis]|uniref:hypothetical protein n=1 Tax=Candidatus Ichthyocystis TaxID=2929841 RepID=UPI0011128556|nr:MULTISPECIES: hypothetical protein [Ichthyocystis]